tara:strand:- start:99 stop:302 length:204 start_codon:yes stop_codon:yes gene_type:complete
MTLSMLKYYKAILVSISIVKEQAFQSLKDNVKGLNTNSIVGIKVDIELTTANYVIVSVIGTAVKVFI